MKKITKFLSVLSPCALILSLAPTISSCKEANKYVTAAEKEIYILGDQVKGEMLFSLSHALTAGQTLQIRNGEGSPFFTFGNLEISNTIVKLPIQKNTNCQEGSKWTGNIVFWCKESNNITAWEYTIENCKVQYTNVVLLNGKKDVRTADGQTNYEFNFSTVLTIPTAYSVEIGCVLDSKASTPNITVTKGEQTVGDNTIKVNVSIAKSETELAGEDYANFKFTFDCRDEQGNTTVWSSNIKGVKLTYSSGMTAINDEAVTVSTDKTTITSIDHTKITAGNMLDLTRDKFENVTTIASNLWNANLASIKYLKFNSLCNDIGANAFDGASFKHIDLTQMSDDSTWFLEGNFGENSFANFVESQGSVGFNANWNSYKIQHMYRALYKAGLTSSGWYNEKEASNIDELREYLEMGSFVKLGENIEYSDGKEITVRNSSVLDLNGKKLKATNNAATTMFGIWNDAELVVKDSSSTQTGEIAVPDAPSTYVTGESDMPIFTIKLSDPTISVYSLDIIGGNFIGHKSIIHNSNSKVMIESGKFSLSKESVKAWAAKQSGQGAKYLLSKDQAGEYMVYTGVFCGWNISKTAGQTTEVNAFDPSQYIPSEERSRITVTKSSNIDNPTTTEEVNSYTLSY